MVFMKQLEEIFTDLKVGDVPLITHDNIFYIRDISEIGGVRLKHLFGKWLKSTKTMI